MLYNMPYIEANYKDFIQFVLSQSPHRHISVRSWQDSEVGDWIRDRELDNAELFDGHGEPVGVFGPTKNERGVYFPMSMYGSESMGGWSDIRISLDEYNVLCYGHLQDYIREHGLTEMKPYEDD